MSPSSLIACHDCDLVQRPPRAEPGAVIKCARCGATLYRQPRPRAIRRGVAYLLGALVLFVVAHSVPVLTMEFQGNRTAATFLGGVRALWIEGDEPVAVVVFLTGFLMPLVQILAGLLVLAPFYLGRRPRYLKHSLRVMQAAGPWSMIEVFVLAVLVSLVKLGHLARVEAGLALWAFGILVFLIAASEAAIDPRSLWSRMERRA